jgi:hypothetical protein
MNETNNLKKNNKINLFLINKICDILNEQKKKSNNNTTYSSNYLRLI